MSKKHRHPVFQVLESGDGGADVSGVTATAADVDTGKVFVDSTGTEVTGTSTYKADYIALSDNIDDLNEDLEEVITGDGTGGGLTVDSVKGLIDGTATTFTIPDGVTNIMGYKFHQMDNLTNINIPDTVATIGDRSFLGCSSLSLYTLPRSLTNIGKFAFANCLGLTSITFLSTPTTIGASGYPVFYECNNLTTIRVPWQEGEVANAPWGAVNSSIIYGYTPS